MTNVTDKIIDKIRKLMTLAQSPNENEAASAAEKVQSLLAEYNLSISQIESKELAKNMVIDSGARTDSVAWRRNLAMSVAELYFCKYFFKLIKVPTATRLYGFMRYNLHMFAGAKHNVEVAKSMFEYLYTAIERLAKEGSMTVPARERSGYVNAFCFTCTVRLMSRIDQRIFEAKKGGIIKSAEGNKNLPALADLYEQAAKDVSNFLNEKVKLKAGKALSEKISHDKGAHDGRSAADKISLDAQIKRGRQSDQQALT